MLKELRRLLKLHSEQFLYSRTRAERLGAFEVEDEMPGHRTRLLIGQLLPIECLAFRCD